jgi:endopeptidase La
MKDFTFPDEKIIHLKRFQNIVRKKIKIKRELNLELNTFYNIIYGIMTRIYDSFLIGILNQYDYNSYMNLLDEQLIIFKKLKRPLEINDINENSKKEISSTIKLLKNNLIELSSKSGIKNIFDGIKLVVNEANKKFLESMDYESKNLLYFYQKVFVPTSMDFYNINKSPTQESDIIIFNNKLDKETYDFKNINKSKGIKCYNIHKKYTNFIEEIQGARLYVPIKFNKKNYYFVFNGYFKEDPLNLARVGGLFQKKHNQIKEIINKLEINEYFKNAYLQQISLRDFIINSVDKIADRCINSYEELLFLKKQTISSLVKDFLVSDITKQRDILTLFLLMKDDIDTQYLAYLMYDMITNESYLLKPQPLAEQVYNSLHWSVQKLFKVAIKKVNNDISKLLNFNEDEISYEKRIMLMKTNDIIKSKAMDKFKEYSKSGESSAKCLQYLDGILKIPFSIYKKEKILTFLSDFKGVLKNFINSNFESNINDKICDDFKKINNITSNHIDHLFNNFNNQIDPEFFGNYDILKILKKMKKNDLKDLIRLINDDGEGNNKINDTLKKKESVEHIFNFLELNDKLGYKYKHYLIKNKDKKQSNILKTKNHKNKFTDLSNQWISYKKDYRQYLNNVDNILDQAVYHQTEAKKQIKRIIAQWINGDMEGYCFGFEGPPGTGKTSLAKKGISKCLKDDNGENRPFSFLALGGSSNGSTLEGHSYTYVGSTWGRIVDVLMETKCMNPIIFIDELDKVSKTENGKEIIGILTHLTDSSQNSGFHDKYFSGIDIDLSKALIIFSYNDYNLLDPILADRIHRVKFTKLSRSEKVHIVNNYLMPELLKTVGISTENIIFSKKTLEFIIETYTHEAGVRKLKERVFEILREINLRYLMYGSDDIKFPFEITNEVIEEIFEGKPKYSIKKITNCPRVGLVNGLYATSSGMGGITIIEAFRTPSEGKLSLELTGQQGDVMKESMKVSKTVAWNLIPKEIKKKIYKEMKESGNFGIHLHCPEGATPKDGPSAGGAITLSIISLLTEIKVNNEVAMTGEIDLNGSIHKIGGLESKIDGGKNAGVKLILYPDQNQEDIDLIKKKNPGLLEDIEIKPIKNIWEILDLCLVKNNLTFNNYLTI